MDADIRDQPVADVRQLELAHGFDVVSGRWQRVVAGKKPSVGLVKVSDVFTTVSVVGVCRGYCQHDARRHAGRHACGRKASQDSAHTSNSLLAIRTRRHPRRAGTDGLRMIETLTYRSVSVNPAGIFGQLCGYSGNWELHPLNIAG